MTIIPSFENIPTWVPWVVGGVLVVGVGYVAWLMYFDNGRGKIEDSHSE